MVEGCSRIWLEECNIIGSKCLGLESIGIYIQRQDPIQLAIQVPENHDTHWDVKIVGNRCLRLLVAIQLCRGIQLNMGFSVVVGAIWTCISIGLRSLQNGQSSENHCT
jgi:hypothetical protein